MCPDEHPRAEIERPPTVRGKMELVRSTQARRKAYVGHEKHLVFVDVKVTFELSAGLDLLFSRCSRLSLASARDNMSQTMDDRVKVSQGYMNTKYG